MDLRHLDARELGRFRIAADRVDIAAKGREAQNRPEYEDCSEKEDARHRQDAPDHRAQQLEGLGGVRPGVNSDHRLVLASGQAAKSERAHHHGQSCDEGLEPTRNDERSVDGSQRKRDAWGDKQHREHAELGRNLRRSRHCDHCADNNAQQYRNADAAPGPEYDLLSPAGVHIAAARQPPENEPSQESDPKSCGDRRGGHGHDRGWSPSRLSEQHGADDRRETHDRADRQIDTAKQDNEGHAGGDQARYRHLAQDVGEIVE